MASSPSPKLTINNYAYREEHSQTAAIKKIPKTNKYAIKQYTTHASGGQTNNGSGVDGKAGSEGGGRESALSNASETCEDKENS